MRQEVVSLHHELLARKASTMQEDLKQLTLQDEKDFNNFPAKISILPATPYGSKLIWAAHGVGRGNMWM